MTTISLSRGVSKREALRIAASIGCRIDYPNKTGEVRVTTPDGRRFRINNRRKDAPLHLLTGLRQRLLKLAKSC